MKNKNSVPIYRRKSLEKFAERLGYELTTASTRTQMKAAGRYEPIPRWELYPSNTERVYETSIHGCRTLSDVADFLDKESIMQALRED